jgi:hypothetical protein
MSDDTVKAIVWSSVFILLAFSPFFMALFSAPYMTQAPKYVQDGTYAVVKWWLSIQFGGFGVVLIAGVIKAVMK